MNGLTVKFSSLLSLLCMLLLSGCSTIIDSHSRKEPMLKAYICGDNESVESILLDKLKAPSMFNSSVVNTGDELMWQLEAGGFFLHMGDYHKSIRHFSRAERLINDYDERAKISVRDVSGEFGSAFVNLNVLPYRGWCRDRMMLEIYKSLAYLGQGRPDAFRAQLRRLRAQQSQIQKDYREFFEREKAENAQVLKKNNYARKLNQQSNVSSLSSDPRNRNFSRDWRAMRKVANRGYGNFLNPAASFLSGLGSILDGNFDNARIDFKRIYEAMPNNPMAQKYYVTMLLKADREIPENLRHVKPFDFPLERNCVYVLTAWDRSAAFKHTSIYFPIITAWPMCEFYQRNFTRCDVSDGTQTFTALPLVDMDGVLAQEFDERLPGIITRIVINTAIKEGIRYGATAVAAQHDELLAAGIFLGSTIYNSATNTADTRTWEMLPVEFALTQLPMPEKRKLQINLSGRKSTELSVDIPENVSSAIIFISAPSVNNVRCHILPLKTK